MQDWQNQSKHTNHRHWCGWLACLIFAVAATLQLAVVSSVRAQEEDEPAAKGEAGSELEERKKPPLEIGELTPRFGSEVVDAGGDEGPRFAIKPGHWTATRQPMQANYKDFIGQFRAEVVDESQQPLPLAHSLFGLRVTRDVTLARGKQRDIEGELFVPGWAEGIRLDARLVDRDSGAEVFQFRPKLELLPAYQYNLVVMAKEPERYAFLKTTNTVRAPWEEEYEESSQVHYQVTLAKSGNTIPLPENPFTWTSVAYLVWDEVDPTRFTTAQQEALLDWLHWGGRLIINGPDSLSSLKGSFLDSLLPADDAGPREIAGDELGRWSTYWGQRESGAAIPPLATSRPFSGIQLKARAESAELPGGEGLFYVRNVGRGSIVVSALQLAEHDFLDWPGFDGFLNGGLLARPRRIFSAGPFDGAQVDWVDYQNRRLDAHFTTPARLFARDFQAAANTRRVTNAVFDPMGAPQDPSRLEVDRPGGVAAWDEFSPAAQVARELLLVAAGVQVPGAAFVLVCLALYLLVLVPLNWLIFYTIERVEWAWIAVPFIAILGTWVVVKQAQLDIGFVRSQSEVAILELSGAHDRGVLSRFTAMYSSLSTTYEIVFPNQEAAAVLPFPANNTDPTDWTESVVFDESSSPRLDGLTVSSSATRLVHAEQIAQLAGPLRMGKSSRGFSQVENHTEYNLRDVAVVRRTFDKKGEPRYEGIWIGDIRQGSSAVLGMAPIMWDAKKLPFISERESAARARTISTMNVDSLVQLAFRFDDKFDPLQSKRDEVRLVGVIDAVLPGMEIEPDASQRQGATVVLAHLDFGSLPTLQPDVNSPSDVVTKENSESL